VKGPKKRGRWSGIEVKKSGEEKRRTRGKDINGIISLRILPEEQLLFFVFKSPS